MTELADFDFSLEFSAPFATMVLSTCFATGATPGHFSFDEPGHSDLVDSRHVSGGPALYQSYLLAIEAGYDLTLGFPVVNFDVPKQSVVVDLQLGIKLPRNIVARIFDVSSVDTALASNPSDVVVSKDYPEEFRSAPRADPYPGHAAPYTPGSIQIQLPVAYATFGQGKRLLAQTTGATRSNVTAVDVKLGAVAAAMVTLASVFASKIFSYLIANEAGGEH